jgi:hypothetical protein
MLKEHCMTEGKRLVISAENGGSRSGDGGNSRRTRNRRRRRSSRISSRYLFIVLYGSNVKV